MSVDTNSAIRVDDGCLPLCKLWLGIVVFSLTPMSFLLKHRPFPDSVRSSFVVTEQMSLPLPTRYGSHLILSYFVPIARCSFSL